jgi:aspartyl-tRNA(Asn)/glutamyl-tRNA(Gln) amidotransferase subunit A
VFLPIAELAGLLRAKKLSPVELVRAYLARIEEWNPRLNAYLTVLADEAVREARRAEREILRGQRRGPLHGIPISLKDNIWTRGVRTTAGSKILAKFVPDADAKIVQRLRAAGAVLLGKTHMHEFAYGVTSNNAHYGPARNPYDLERIPGGSSGGSAVAVAAGLCAGSVGTDTGGSIRIPAALCGITGFKPTMHSLPMEGIVPLCRSFDHVGPLTRTVQDAALLYDGLRGGGRRESLAHAYRKKPTEERTGRSRRLRIGWPKDYFFDRVTPEVRKAVEAARDVFEDCGVEFREVSLPHLSEAYRAATVIALAEGHQFHREAGYYPARASEYSEELRTRLEKGAQITAGDYLDARRVCREATKDFWNCMDRVDAFLAPTVPVAAPRIGEETVTIAGEEEDVRYALLRLCRPGNYSGMPAISLPCGATPEGLPIGLQIMGFWWREAEMLWVAERFEEATPWHRRRPALV